MMSTQGKGKGEGKDKGGDTAPWFNGATVGYCVGSIVGVEAFMAAAVGVAVGAGGWQPLTVDVAKDVVETWLGAT